MSIEKEKLMGKFGGHDFPMKSRVLLSGIASEKDGLSQIESPKHPDHSWAHNVNEICSINKVNICVVITSKDCDRLNKFCGKKLTN